MVAADHKVGVLPPCVHVLRLYLPVNDARHRILAPLPRLGPEAPFLNLLPLQVRVNTISAGPLGSRAAKAIGFIDDMIAYSYANAPVQKELAAREVGNCAAFLLSPLASAVTGHVMYVDNGLNNMGLAVDSKTLDRTAA